jgi:Fanconi anemia group M protein
MKVSPTEPIPFSKLGETSSLPERHGVDFFWVANGITWGIQRKRFPDDFLASLSDGRLAKELAQMQSLDRPMIVLEGLGTWTNDGYLLDQKFHASQLYGWMLSCFFEKQIPVFQVRSERDALFFIDRVEAWSLRKSHHSLSRRPKPKGNMWGQKENKDWGIHLLQSFEGIGPSAAQAIYEHFGHIPLQWTVTEKDLMEIEGIGKGKAMTLLNSL